MKTGWEFEWAKPEEFEENRKKASEVSANFEKKWKGTKGYLEKPEILKQALTEYESLIRNFTSAGSEGYYYTLKQLLDTSDPKIKAKFNSVYEFIVKEDSKLNFFPISLGKIGKEKQKEFLESEELKEYKTFLKDTFRLSKYMLSEKEEFIISLKDLPANDMWVQMLETLLTKETGIVEGKEKTFPELASIMQEKDKGLRDEAKNEFNKILNKYSDVAENEINAVLTNYKSDLELRGFERADLPRLVQDAVSPKFIEELLSAVSKRVDISKEYYEFKAKIMGQEKIGYHEREAQVGDFSKKYSYVEAVEIVRKMFSNMDKEFIEIFDGFLENGRIDAFPKKGKTSGAACVNTGITLPTYIFLNYNGSFEDIKAIAHETGHGINSELIRKKQNALYFDSPLSTGEVASTFFEDFALNEILKDCNEEEKFSILMKKLDEDINAIIRQVAAYKFELELHETHSKEGYLANEVINEIFSKHMKEYMGEAVDISDSKNWWIYWSHFREPFYVYSYASGLLISKSMQNKYKENPEFIEKIKEFFSTGTSLNPEEIFKKMGIEANEEFFSEGLKELENNLKEAKLLAKKLGKI